MSDKFQKLVKLLEILQSEVVTPSQLREFLDAIVVAVGESKNGLQSISKENVAKMQEAIEYIESNRETIIESMREMAHDASRDFDEKLKKLEKYQKKIEKTLKPTKEELLEIIEPLIPERDERSDSEAVEIEQESGESIVDKINSLPLEEESMIDAKHIKNLPEPSKKGGKGFGSMMKEAPRDGIIYGRKNREWVEVEVGSLEWGSITGDIENQTDLQDALDDAITEAVSTSEAYANGLVVGLWDDRGSFDASGGSYPSVGGSGTAGAILKGDIWTVSVAGTLPTGQVVEIGDVVRALTDTPGNTQANWAITQNNIGYVAENSANKSTDGTFGANSDVLYPSQKAAKTYADTKVASVSGTTNRITSTGGTTPVIDISVSYVGQSSITTLGTITTGAWNGTTIAIANGGTGQTTANAAFNALVPSQTSNSGKFLTTNGTDTSWGTPSTVATAVPLSGITAATGNNTINSGAFVQEWQWNTLAGTDAFKLSSTSTAAASNAQVLLNIALSGTNGTSAQTTYAAKISNTHAGTTSTNVALLLTATGGTTANYALIVPNNGSFVGIGTSTPTAALHVVPTAGSNSTPAIRLQPPNLTQTLDMTWGGGTSTFGWQWIAFNGGGVGAASFDWFYQNTKIMSMAVTTGYLALGNYTATSRQEIRKDGLGVTQTAIDGLLMSNTTAAAAGAQQISTAIEWSGRGWKTTATAASQTVNFRAFVTPVQGAANPTGYWGIGSSINGAAYSDGQMVVTSDGNVGIGTVTPTSVLHVERNTSSGVAYPNILIKNLSTSSNSYSALDIQANGTTVWGQLLNDGLGGVLGAPGVAFRVITNHPFFITTNNTVRVTVAAAGNVGIGVTPTAVLHLKAGTATASTAPLKFTSGTVMTAPEAGAIEFDTDTLYATITTGTERKKIAYAKMNTAFSNSVVALVDGATIAVDATLGNVFTVTLGGNRTLSNPTGAVDGQKLEFRIRQDGTGSRTLAFDTKFRFGTDLTGITLTTTINKTDYIGTVYHAADDKFDVVAFMKGY